MILEHTTIKEVADRARVSTATVSRILSGKHCHRSTTVETVRRAIEELRSAGPVLTGFESAAPESVGIVMFAYRDFLNSGYNATLATAIMETLTAEDFSAQFIALSSKRLSIDYIESLVREHRLKGLLIPEFDMLYTVSEQLAKLPIPVVCIGNLAETGLRYSVCADNVSAGRDAANYLWSRGHRRFGIVTMSRSDICQAQRTAGFLETLRELGGAPEQVMIREYRSLNDSVSGVISALANMQERPTALFSTNSLMTQKLIVGAAAVGIRVPEELSLLSLEENNELLYMPVPVSVIRQPTRELGEAAVRMLISLIRGLAVPEHEVLNCSLVSRSSVAKRNE